jgi:large subunit ribosomal protein L29
MDIDKVRGLTDTELYVELGTQRRQLYDLRFQLATRQLTDNSQLTQTRRTIARVLTVMTERGLDERVAPQPTVEPAAPPTPRRRRRGAAAPAAAEPATAEPAAAGESVGLEAAEPDTDVLEDDQNAQVTDEPGGEQE